MEIEAFLGEGEGEKRRVREEGGEEEEEWEKHCWCFSGLCGNGGFRVWERDLWGRRREEKG